MSTQTAAEPTLSELIQAHYPVHGVDAKGRYVGAEKFKAKMVELLKEYHDQDVRAEINMMTKSRELPMHGPLITSTDPLDVWVRAQYPIHCIMTNGTKMANAQKIVTVLFSKLPSSLSGQSGQLVSAVCKMLEQMGVSSKNMKKVGAQEWLDSQLKPSGPSRQKCLQEWVEDEYRRSHSGKSSVSKIANALFLTLPAHLRGQNAQLRAAVETMLLKKGKLTAPSGAASSVTTPIASYAPSLEEIEVIPAAVHSSEVLERQSIPQKSTMVSAAVPTFPSDSHSSTSYPGQGKEQVLHERSNGSLPEAPRPEPIVRRNAKVVAALESSEEEADTDDEAFDNVPSLEDQMCLLSSIKLTENEDGASLANTDIKNAVVFSAQVLKDHRKLLPQYGLLGEAFTTGAGDVDPRLFLNTNHPFSVFLCGLQGAGKSHSLSCLLENCLLPTRTLGVLKRPLSAMVFHFSQYTSRVNFRPCEAAFIACPDPKFKDQCRSVPVTVLVPPSNYLGLRSAYSQIPGVTVQKFLLRPEDLNIGSMLTLMSVSQSGAQPLYVSHVTKILREMAGESSDFDFLEFKRRLSEVRLLPLQRKPLEQRLELLESFLDLNGQCDVFDFEEGSITIVDLSCPFVDENTACVLFNIALGVFLQDSTPGAGKVVAIDEAHKYITDTPASKIFTESLLQLIRQQRHYGARIIISTQEPTIDPRLMDLCSITLIHRFTSPEWFKILTRHVSIMEDQDAELFRRIISLRVGEGLIFCPGAVVAKSVVGEKTKDEDAISWEEEQDGAADGSTQQRVRIEKLGSRFLKTKIRRRLTADGGKSLVCV